MRSEGERQREGGQHGLGGQLKLLQLGLLQSLGLGPAVLEPDLHLCLCEAERVGELRALRDGEVLFLAELPLQGEQLSRGEGRPGLPVVLVFAQVARRRAEESWKRRWREGASRGEERSNCGLLCLTWLSCAG